MRVLFRILHAALILAALAVPLQAQTTTTSTVLGAAITSTTQTQVSVASATGITASTASAQRFIYVNRELMQVRSISGTTLTVIRGVGGTVATTHFANTVVFYGAPGAFNGGTGNTRGVFLASDPRGSCTPSGNEFLPVINPDTGNIFTCTSLNSKIHNNPVGATGGEAAVFQWQAINLLPISASVPYRSITNAAYTASLADYFIDYNSMTAGRTVTLPAVTGIYGKVMVIKHSAQSFDVTVAAPVGQYVLTVGTASTTLSSGMSLRLISVGGGWATF